MASKKILNDAYFTSPEIAEHCFKKTLEVIGEENISEFIESSSGEGIFLDMIEKYTPNIPYKAYDIDVRDKRVIEQDFLKLEMEYKKGRLTGFNPPFGRGNTLAVKFYKKSIQISEYITFILPISQYNNNQQMYEFDLVYSEDLGKSLYTDRLLHCCLNIYKKENNKKIDYTLKDIELKQCRKRNGNFNIKNFEYDFAFCIRGDIGKICEVGTYNDMIMLKCKNKQYLNEVIKNILNIKNFISNDISTQSLKSWQVYKYLKEMIPELE